MRVVLQFLGYGARGIVNKLTGRLSKGLRETFDMASKSSVKDFLKGKNIFKAGYETSYQGVQAFNKQIEKGLIFVNHKTERFIDFEAINKILKAKDSFVRKSFKFEAKTLNEQAQRDLNGVIQGSALRIGFKIVL